MPRSSPIPGPFSQSRPTGVGRRAFLGGAVGVVAAGLAAREARADAAAPGDRRFLFVYAMGGWDVTRVFAPAFGASGVAMEPDAVPRTAGGIDFVDHPGRPSVRAFFDAHHESVALLNGIHLSSIAHASATRLITTGTPDASVADWPSRLAAARANAHLIPCFVVGGPSFAGPHGVHVGRAGTDSQLQDLCTGDIVANSDTPLVSPDDADIERVNRWLAEATRRAAMRQSGARSRALTEDYEIALDRATQLRAVVGEVNLDRGSTFGEQVELAARVLSGGVSRCVCVAHPRPEVTIDWDSHAGNDGAQNLLFEDLFAELMTLREVLAATPGASAPTLADETVVVVLSEMARTPTINGTGGKDHWPFTSALLFGPGVRGDLVVGGYDEALYGSNIDIGTGATDSAGTTLIPNLLGATLLALGDVDPEAEGIADPAVAAVLA